MVGGAILTASHVLNGIPNKSKDTTPYKIWVGRKPSLSYLRTWGCLVKVNVPITKKRKLGPKTVDCVFLGYAHNSIAYRFLVVKSEFMICMLIQFLNLVMLHSLRSFFL
jgi:hypothetical protein